MPPRRIPRRVYRASARVLDQGGPERKLRGRPPPPHCRAPDLGDGRGLNPSPDEREPAGPEYYSRRLTKTTRFAIRKTSASAPGDAFDRAKPAVGGGLAGRRLAL